MSHGNPMIIFRQSIVLLMVMLTAMCGLNGCATLDQLIQKPTASFSGMNLTHADLLKGSAVFNFKVNNPNPIGIRASRITYDLKLNGRNFVAGELDQGMHLAAGSTSTLQVPVTMAYLDFFESVTRLWQAKGADYALTGGFNVGPFRIPFQAHGNFSLPKMPRISLEAIRVENLSPSGARLNCRLKMDNPNDFDFWFKRLDYNLNLGGTSFAKASARPQGAVAGNGNSLMNFGIDVSFANMGFAAYQLLLGRNADYKLDGAMGFDSPGGEEQKVPLNLTGRVPFAR